MGPGTDHRHCKNCGRVCDPDEETCSDACRERREQVLATRRNYTYLMYGVMALLVILFLFRIV